MAHPGKSSQQTLRNQAEVWVQNNASTTAPHKLQDLSREAMVKTLHELQVHQIELEIQNEELRKTQINLDAARARYFDLYDLAPVGYCTISEQGLVQEANFTAATMLNVVRSELVNMPVSRLIFKADQDIYYRCRKALLETNAPQDCELRMNKRGADAFWVHIWVSVAQDLQGETVHRVVLSDISERKKMDDALVTKNQEIAAARVVAEKASRAKIDFLSNMTHELRTPLNAILGCAQLLDGSTPPPRPEQVPHVKHILRAGWYLLDLVGEILDLTAIESGELKLPLIPLPLADVLQECCASVAPAAKKVGVEIKLGQTNPALQVLANRARLQQVMVHVLSNAIQYNRAGGSVEVACSVEPRQRLRISVKDTGYGLSGDQIAHLFQPFNRFGRESSADEGTGVGLALSKRLVELMGGSIGADSTVGVGSTFWIELNLSETRQEGAA